MLTFENIPEYKLHPIYTPLRYIKDILLCLCHTILFHRVLEVLSPIEVMGDSIDIVYIKGDKPEVHKKITSEIEKCLNTLKEESETVQFNLSFYELYTGTSFFGETQKERIYENWLITLKIQKKMQNETKTLEDIEKAIQKNLLFISEKSEKTLYLPSYTAKSSLQFSLKPIVKEEFGVLSFFLAAANDLVKSGPPKA